MTQPKPSLSRLARLESEATPGPWSHCVNDNVIEAWVRDGYFALAEVSGAEATLIVESRNALPVLLRAVKAAKAYPVECHEDCASWPAHHGNPCDCGAHELSEALAEVEE